MENLDQKLLLDNSTKLLERTLAFIPRVETRSQVLVGANLAMVLTLAVNAPPKTLWAWPMILSVVAIGLNTASLWKLFLGSFPQLEGGSNSLIYFREIAKLREADFLDRFMALDATTLTKDTLGQVWRNAQVAAYKFECLKTAMMMFAFSVPVWAIGLAMFVMSTQRWAR